MKRPALVWNDWNKEHIKKHLVTISEAEEAYDKSNLVAKGKDNRVLILSKIKNGKMIALFLSFKKQPLPYVVSARDASKKERRIYEKNIHNI